MARIFFIGGQYTIVMTISIGLEDRRILTYITDFLKSKEIKYAEVQSLKRAEITVDNPSRRERELFADLVADTLALFYKLSMIKKPFADAKPSMALAAYLGSVLNFDKTSDAIKIKALIADMDTVCIDGIFNFNIPEITDSWDEFSALAIRLFTSCATETEIYELTNFMMGIDARELGVVRYDSEAKVLYSAGNPVVIANLMDDYDMNLICNMMYYHPANIIISDPSLISSKLLTAIKSLGDIQQ
jgi:hypothetical protein